MSRIAVALAFLAPAFTLAQSPRPLGKPDAEYAEPFTSVNGVRELRDGRVVVLDTRDKVVQLVDLKNGTARKIGREGAGPREYALPLSLHALPGDTTAVFDPLNSRFLLVTPGGEAGEFMRLPAPSSAGGSGGVTMVSMTPPRFVDRRGRFYTLGSGIKLVDGQPVPADSLPILRIDRGTQRTDTMGYVRQPKENIQTSGGAGRMEVRAGMANPFVARDDWAVTPDGRVALVRAPEYRVDWVGPERATGPAIPYQRVKVSEAHKRQWRDSRRNQTAIMVTNNNGRTTTTSGAVGSGGFTLPEPTDWPEYLPPFLASGTGVLVAPDGALWVPRTREASDQVPTYDVIDASGRVSQRVALAPRTRVVGFGTGTIYTVRTDEDDLQYLQRYRLPAR